MNEGKRLNLKYSKPNLIKQNEKYKTQIDKATTKNKTTIKNKNIKETITNPKKQVNKHIKTKNQKTETNNQKTKSDKWKTKTNKKKSKANIYIKKENVAFSNDLFHLKSITATKKSKVQVKLKSNMRNVSKQLNLWKFLGSEKNLVLLMSLIYYLNE